MEKAIDRLAELVRQAEAKTRAQKLGSETENAAEALAAADQRARQTDALFRERRPALQKQIQEVAEDEQKLKDLIRKVAILRGTASLDEATVRVFEAEIASSRAEIDQRQKAASEELEALQRAATEARKLLEDAREHYVALRRELDRLLPQVAGGFAEADRVARSAEGLTPGGQVRALAREVDDALPHFGVLDGREQLAQLTIWIGRFRRLQAYELANLTEEEKAALQRVFPKLVGISKQYEPGYIEAFRQTYNTDWDDYVTRAEEALKSATDLARQRRELESRRRELVARADDRQQAARVDGDAAFDDLRAVLTRYELPADPEGHLPFYEALDRVIAARGISEPELVELLLPYRDLLTGSAYRSLRKHIDRLRQQDERTDESLQTEYRDLLSFSRGKHAVMIGGSAREDARRSLERVFGFEDLDWEDHESNRPALLDSIESRIRNGGVDLVLILKSFVGHNVTDRLKPACEKAGIPCLLVDKGYGPSQIAEVLRRGLPKLN